MRAERGRAGRLAACAEVLALGIGAAPASAEVANPACYDASAQVEARIAACTAEIDTADLTSADLALAFFHRAQARAAKGDAAGALEDYGAAVKLKPNFAAAAYDRGLLAARVGRLDEALADLTRAIRIEPGYAPAFKARGDVWASKQEPDRAIAGFTEAIRLNPKFAAAYNDRGTAWGMKGDFDRGHRRFQPRHPARSHRRLGVPQPRPCLGPEGRSGPLAGRLRPGEGLGAPTLTGRARPGPRLDATRHTSHWASREGAREQWSTCIERCWRSLEPMARAELAVTGWSRRGPSGRPRSGALRAALSSP